MASSASIYGMAEAFPTTEAHHPYNNRTLYGAAKTFGEGLLRSFNDMYGLDYVALRYFNVYGPRMDIHGRYTEVMVRWMERIEAGLPPIIFGDGLQTMDMIARPRRRPRQHPGRARRRRATRSSTSAARPRPRSLDLAGELARAMGRPVADAGARGGARREPGAPPARLRRGRGRRCSASARRSAREAGIRDLVDWWRGETPPASRSKAS